MKYQRTLFITYPDRGRLSCYRFHYIIGVPIAPLSQPSMQSLRISGAIYLNITAFIPFFLLILNYPSFIQVFSFSMKTAL